MAEPTLAPDAAGITESTPATSPTAAQAAHDDIPTGPMTLSDIDWPRFIPYALLHLSCLTVFFVGWSWIAVAVCFAMYVFHMFVITAFYHRYFSHRAFRTSRVVQLLGAIAATSSAQRGPLWWAAHHRHHHNHSDETHDAHSPNRLGLLTSHMGWFLRKGAEKTADRYVRDWAKFPELIWVNRYHWLIPIALGGAMFLLGAGLNWLFPSLGTSGWQMLVWGFVISTIIVYHATYTINSLSHRFGRVRFNTGDDSRNNIFLALLTLGEGWHNNHHYFPASARQGFKWWEIDLTYYGLLVMERLGLIWDLRGVPDRVMAQRDDGARPDARG